MASQELDVSDLTSRLDLENQDFRLHIDAETPLSKYPGEILRVHTLSTQILTSLFS
jgi:hypothetical protein